MEPLKNNISADLVLCFADHLEKRLDAFDRASFEKGILSKLDALELKERSQLIADYLHAVLPKDSNIRYPILLDMLHVDEDTGQPQPSNAQGIRGWGMMPLCAVVGQHGLETFDESMDVLKKMTSLFSSELDACSFLLEDQERALKIMTGWVNHSNHHIRRLVSEGTRPRLPWAMQLPRLITDPSPVLPLLEKLRDDKEEYVRRSVANHLNDISKDHPDLVADLAKKWMKNADKNRRKLLRHACRTLIKQGHPVALAAFGFTHPKIELKALYIKTPAVPLGDKLNFSVQIQSTDNKPQSLVIDYLIYFKKANGALSPKVFKWTTLEMNAKDTICLQRSHAIRPITTRKYYEGEQALSLRINGRDYEYETFNLKM